MRQITALDFARYKKEVKIGWPATKRVGEGQEFMELWYQVKEQNLFVYMLSDYYCPRNCVFSAEGRKTEEEGEKE